MKNKHINCNWNGDWLKSDGIKTFWNRGNLKFLYHQINVEINGIFQGLNIDGTKDYISQRTMDGMNGVLVEFKY